MNKISVLALSCILFFNACKKEVKAPAPYGALPTQAQMDWQKMEYYMFIHFGPNTFTDKEWGDGKEDPKIFNPTDLDCRQWAATAKAAGMKGIIITAKHHDGFCLWPSNYSTHTVRESAWKDGKGDVLKELSEACKEYGLKFGVYLSPWDQNHPDYGTDEYNQIFANTLTEVLTGYGDVFEQWFDGANGEGPNGKKQVYDWDLFNSTVYKYHPDAIIFGGTDLGCRWIGNERGFAGETNWSRLHKAGTSIDSLPIGNINGDKWAPGEADTSIRPGWFYSPNTDDKVKSLAQLMDIYHKSVGRNANLLLNVPPDRTGRIHQNDSIRLMELRVALDEMFKTNLAKGSIKASNVRGNSKTYAIENLLNDNYDSYWATDDEVLTASFELELTTNQDVNKLVLQEYIPLGQRVAQFNIEYWDTETKNWKELTKGTTIGYKRILSFPTVNTSKIKVNITESLACPILNSIQLFNAPDYTDTAKSQDIKALSTQGAKMISPTKDAVIDGKVDQIVEIPMKEPVVIDLGKNQTIKGFFYIPEAAVTAPNISRYDFYVSQDGKNWNKVFSNKLFENLKNNPIRQDVKLDKETEVRFIKLQPLELTNGNNNYKVVEIGIL